MDAESILSGLAGNIITKLGSLVVQEFALAWGVRDELDELKNTVSAIKAVLLDVDEQQSKNHQVEDWVSKVRDALYDIDDLFDEWSYETLRRQVMGGDRRKMCKQVGTFFSKSNPIALAFKMGHKIKDIRERLKNIDANKNQYSLSTNMVEHLVLRDDRLRKARETCSYILEEDVIGRNDDKEKIIGLLSNSTIKEDIAIISIIGMGGLGKTALAQSIYNDNIVVNHFELKLWVCVSEEFDVKVIIEKIIESATRKKLKSSLQLESLQNQLKKQIDGKRYLLVMDDVWNENYEEWVKLKTLLKGGTKGSRILITTRSEQVAKTFDTTLWHHLEKLDEGNSWLLFKKMTSLEGSEKEFENSNLVEIGKEIVAKLEGVPLAIRIIGRFLYDNKSKDFWLSFKEKELYQALDQRYQLKDKLLPLLKLSYNHLPSNLKQCFLYCALFPKDYKIQKDELILQWRAQGFFQPNDKDKFVDIGEDYFMELISRSFFQDVTKNKLGDIEACKMHDLMHDLACSIVKKECGSDVSNGSTPIHERTHHISLHSPLENLGELLEMLPKARNLRTFFMLNHEYDCVNGMFKKRIYNLLRLRALKLNHKNPSAEFLESMYKLKHLRYLSLLGSSKVIVLPNSITELFNLETLILTDFRYLKKLPVYVKNWINLRHFDLSCAHSLRYLPDSITHLNNLETLILFCCDSLRELPRDIKKLINLKHLDMDGCLNLTHMPKGIGEITNLQTMNLFAIGKDEGGGLSEFNGLNKLRGSLMITGLQFCTSVDLQTNAKLLNSGLQSLILCWDYDQYYSTSVLGGLDGEYERCLQPHSNLREIIIFGYKEVTLCNWLSSNSFGCLVGLKLVSCRNLEKLPQLDTLPCLKQLILEDLPNIEYVVNNDSLSSSICFQSLEKLSIASMPKLKRWWKDTTSIQSDESTEGWFPMIFPCLSQLDIVYCPFCILISLHAPNLKSLRISATMEKDEFDVVPWKNFKNISTLKLSSVFNSEYFPKGLQHLTALQHLSVECWKYLKSLPEWIDNFTSLKHLEIHYCENLTSLPEGIGNLTSLTHLNIASCKNLLSLPEGFLHIHCLQSLKIRNSPILTEWCKKEIEFWTKITRIPDVCIE